MIGVSERSQHRCSYESLMFIAVFGVIVITYLREAIG
ncbi:Uncharacterised protein [Vibrio cholerae]|nr:Uncharacterised protein [Vibrio cholerae]